MDISPGLAFLHLTGSELIMRPADIDFHHKDEDQRPAWRKSLQSQLYPSHQQCVYSFLALIINF